MEKSLNFEKIYDFLLKNIFLLEGKKLYLVAVNELEVEKLS